jgi:HD-like signal output (HDOD) protein
MTALWSTEPEPRRTTADTTERPSAPPADCRRLLACADLIPAARPALLRLLQTLEDPRSSASDVARDAGGDVKVTSRLMRLANSAYFGRSGRVSSLQEAVTVVGFETVRAMTVAVAANLSSDPSSLPPLFWQRAALSATGAALAAPAVHAAPQEAFCVGLLADIGAALMFADSPHVYRNAGRTCDTDIIAEEIRTFGASHADLGRILADNWLFPQHLSAAIGDHHQPVDSSSLPLRRALAAGLDLAGRILAEDHGMLFTAAEGPTAEESGDPEILQLQMEQTRRDAAPLLEGLLDA